MTVFNEDGVFERNFDTHLIKSMDITRELGNIYTLAEIYLRGLEYIRPRTGKYLRVWWGIFARQLGNVGSVSKPHCSRFFVPKNIWDHSRTRHENHERNDFSLSKIVFFWFCQIFLPLQERYRNRIAVCFSSTERIVYYSQLRKKIGRKLNFCVKNVISTIPSRSIQFRLN